MSGLGGGENPFHDDDGSVGPELSAALEAYASGRGSEHAALTALARSRLLVPVVATATEHEDGQPGRGEAASEMAMPTLIGSDGRPAIPAFTCLASLARWRADARPTPAGARSVWRAAAADSCAVVVDIAGPVPLVVDGACLAALAAGQAVPQSHEDSDVQAAVAAVTARHPAVTGVRLAPAGSGADVDLVVWLTLAPAGAGEAADADATARLVGSEVVAVLGGRLRRGIAVAVAASRPAGCG